MQILGYKQWQQVTTHFCFVYVCAECACVEMQGWVIFLLSKDLYPNTRVLFTQMYVKSFKT